MKMFFWLSLTVLCSNSARGFTEQTAKALWTLDEGLSAPDSAHYDPKTNSIFVSNMGNGVTKYAIGYISQVSLDGTMIVKEWATGIDSPRGLRVFKGNLLWVATGKRLLIFSVKDRKLLHTIQVPGSTALNDIALDTDGNAYVSDAKEGAIYFIKNHHPSIFVHGPQLDRPNGLLVSYPYLRVASASSVYNINLSNKKKSLITEALLNLDGIEDTSDGIVVSDEASGSVFLVRKTIVQRLLTNLKGAADIGIVKNKNIFIVPETRGNRLSAFQFN